MRINCENCRTVFELSAINEDSGACPYCEHVNPRGSALNGDGEAAEPRPSNGAAALKPDIGTSTMLFPPDAETKPDPDTSIRQVTTGKTPSLPAGRPPFELVVVEGDEIGKRFVISKPQVVIGRSVKADIQLKDSEVSREHCMIESFGRRWRSPARKTARGKKRTAPTARRVRAFAASTPCAGPPSTGGGDCPS
jgi:hypothetical protein